MTKLKTKLLLLFLFFSSFIYAQENMNWKYLGDTNDGSEIYMKIENNDSYQKHAWIKTKKAFSSKKNKKDKIIKIGGGSTIGYWIVNCSEKTYSITNRISYNSKGTVISESDQYNDPSDERVIPDTVGEAIFTNICNYTPE